MFLFIVVNIICYLLISYLVFRFYTVLILFLFQYKWIKNNMEDTCKNKKEYIDLKQELSQENKSKEEKKMIHIKLVKDNRKLSGEPSSSFVKHCFELISAVDYLNLDRVSFNEGESSVRLQDKKCMGSMFEELLQCLEGKTRTDFYTWEDVLSGREDSVKILLERNFSIDGTDREGDSLLHYACRTQDKQTVTDLLEKGARILVNKKSQSPLHISASTGHIDITKILLKNNALVNLSDNLGFTPIHLAVKSDNEELVQLLINNGADISAKTESHVQPIHFSLSNCDILKLLISKNVDLNAESKDGSTPLHFASRGNCYESLEILLKNKALINVKDINGSTALLILCKNFSFYSEDNIKCFRCVKLLLEQGACVNFTDHCGVGPLHFAAENELIDILELLLEFGANPNIISETGDSPLHIAVRNQSLEVVYTLLEWGADINIKGLLGETPLDIAAQSLLMFNVWNYSSEVLVKHIAKLTSASINLPKSDSNLILYKKMSSEFVRRCSEEVNKLSLKTLVPSLTYQDVLTKYEGYLTKYVRHSHVEELFQLGDYLTEFPLYSSLLTLRFRQGFERNYLIKKSYKYLKNVCVSLPLLNFDSFEVICSYLNVYELRNLCHAFQSDIHGDDVKGCCSVCKGSSTLPRHKISQPPGTKRYQLIKILNY